MFIIIKASKIHLFQDQILKGALRMYRFIPSGVCCKEITYDIVDGRVYNIHFEGGCNGNGKGIAILAEGHTPEELISMLKDVQCKDRGTSCPAQLARSLQEARDISAEKTQAVLDTAVYQTYVRILREELVPAMGCTEPIAIAYCAAKARQVLGCLPDRIDMEVSGNIIKNVKSVVVPHTGGRRGMKAAVAAGVVAGDPDCELEVISNVSDEQIKEMETYLQTAQINICPADSDLVLDICITAFHGQSRVTVRIVNHHTGIVLIEKDGQVLFEAPIQDDGQQSPDFDLLTVEGIFNFVNTLKVDDVRPILDRQIAYNSAIAEEGLRGDYGASVGKNLLKMNGSDVRTRARAMAAAGSDARMNGCELPVVINSGSGNQGMTVSLPVLEYAKELNCDQDMTYRALTLSNLVALHLKSGIGRLSAYCGAISAGVAAGAAICYLKGGDLEAISHTIVNALAISSGVICDGAKASCAAKISLAVDTGIFGYELYQNGRQFYSGDGIVSKGVENTIQNVNILGKEGMRQTDKTIIKIMASGD